MRSLLSCDMLSISPSIRIFVHALPTDMRKGFNGLCAVVEHDLGLNPFAHAVFVFGNRRKDRIKILGWNRNGFFWWRRVGHNQRVQQVKKPCNSASARC